MLLYSYLCGTTLADKGIRRLFGTVLIDADEKLVNPNGVELRLGKHVLFHSTGEGAELSSDCFLKVSPGESVAISSVELIDFKAETVQRVLPGKMLMGFITPTTTMMREGITQASTKIDAGFRGNLNWGLRNGSTKDLVLRYGEPIFKLTVFELGQDESPEIPYGGRPRDGYQDTEGQCCPGKVAPTDGKSLPLNVLWPVLPGNDLKSRGRKWPPERSIPTRHNGG